MQNILINLSIISKIKPNDKVFINSEHFISIEYDSIFQGIVRFFYNNSRIKTVNHLIQINPCHVAFCLKGKIIHV